MLRHLEYFGESEAEGLIQWLNKAPRNEAYRRVTELLNILRDLQRSRDPDSDLSAFHMRSPEVNSLPERIAVLKTLNKYLARYVFRPQVRDASSSSQLLILWSFHDRQDTGIVSIDVPEGRTRFGESDAVIATLKLAKDKFLTQIRECECGNWFFARFAHQAFCGHKCRQKNYRASDTSREKRRVYMRRYRRKKRTKNVSKPGSRTAKTAVTSRT